MIKELIEGDITEVTNRRDIIIAMNSQMRELTALGRQVTAGLIPPAFLKLGSVLTFSFDEGRRLHMAICHELGPEGWRTAPLFLRYCLDTLWVQHPDREYSIVRIGAGRIGQRDGADIIKLQRVIEHSFLPVVMFTRNEKKRHNSEPLPALTYEQGWSIEEGIHTPDLAATAVS